MSSRHRVQALLEHPRIWRAGEAGRPGSQLLPTGYPALDRALGGGWPLGKLSELLVDLWGSGEFRLLLPALRQAMQDRHGSAAHRAAWVMLIDPPYIPYAPALAGAGIDIARVLVARCRHGEDVLWAVEQAVRSGACAVVLAWCDRIAQRALRRLQLAAETGRCWVVLFRSAGCRGQRSPAAVRLYLRPVCEARLSVDVFKCRGGRPAQLLMEF